MHAIWHESMWAQKLEVKEHSEIIEAKENLSCPPENLIVATKPAAAPNQPISPQLFESLQVRGNICCRDNGGY